MDLELICAARLRENDAKIHFWRDANGHEVDWIINQNEMLTPIEVKWTDRPTRQNARYLEIFRKEYGNATQGYVICQTPRKIKLAEDIYALPWQELDTLFL